MKTTKIFKNGLHGDNDLNKTLVLASAFETNDGSFCPYQSNTRQ